MKCLRNMTLRNDWINWDFWPEEEIEEHHNSSCLSRHAGSSPLPIFTPGTAGIDGRTLEQGRFKTEFRRTGAAEVKIAVTEAWRPPRRQRDPTWTQVHTFARHGSDLTLGWGKLLTLFSYFDRNLILKWLLFCLLGGKKHLWGCLFSTDAPTPSFTHFFPCHPFCLCPDTFCPCHSSSRVKNSGVGFDYLITMVTRMTLMPICAWQDSANLYFSASQEKGSLFSCSQLTATSVQELLMLHHEVIC